MSFWKFHEVSFQVPEIVARYEYVDNILQRMWTIDMRINFDNGLSAKWSVFLINTFLVLLSWAQQLLRDIVTEAEILCDRAVMVGAAIKENPYCSITGNMKMQNGTGVKG